LPVHSADLAAIICDTSELGHEPLDCIRDFGHPFDEKHVARTLNQADLAVGDVGRPGTLRISVG
jgi:hypothetical protein